MTAASMLGLLLLHASAGSTEPTPRAADCAAYAAVRERVARAREMIASGASEDELPALDGAETALRTCFRQQVLPALAKAETDDKLIDRAANDFFAWARQAALLDIIGRLAAEEADGVASLTIGLSHAYGVAKDKCVRLHDSSQIDVMLRLLHWSQLRGIELTTALDDDIAGCMRGASYLVQVRVTTSTSGHGTGSEFHYTAVLRPVPRGAAGELAGRGRWAGFVVARKANCHQAAKGGAQRFDVAGALEATGTMLDLPASGGRPQTGFLYALKTLDWPLKPIFGGDSPFAETAEEREGLAGAGSVFAFEPIALTSRATTTVDTATISRSCDGETTMRTESRVVRLATPR